MTWTPIDTKTEQHGPRNPYEAWDTLGLIGIRAEDTLFHRVFVQLKQDAGGKTYVKAAGRFLQEIAGPDPDTDTDPDTGPVEKFYVPDSTQRILIRLENGESSLTVGKVFVYRLARHAYSKILNGKDDIVEAVLHVGPVIPGQTAPDARRERVDVPVLNKANVPLSVPVSVLTAVIDDEIGFLNSRFRADPQRTRIKRFWSMAPERLKSSQGAEVAFGRVLTDEQIESIYLPMVAHGGEPAAYARLDQEAARAASGQPLQAGRFRDPAYRRPRALVASHGTAVLDLAAGRAPDETAPKHPSDPIFAVELPQLATADTSGGWLDAYVLQAVIEVMDWADSVPTSPADDEAADEAADEADDNESGQITLKPLVINLSYGINAGPKDGSGFLAHHLAELVEQRNKLAPTWMVLPSGNSYEARGRADVGLAQGNASDLVWQISPDDASPSFLEVFLQGKARLILTAPGAGPLEVTVGGGAHQEWQFVPEMGQPSQALYVQPHKNGSRVTWALAPTRPGGAQNGALALSGEYTLRIEAYDGPVTGSVEVQRDDTPSGYSTGARQSVLTLKEASGYSQDIKTGEFTKPQSPLTRDGTISDYATAQSPHILVVGAAANVPDSGQIKAADYTSAGTGQIEPDLSILCEDGQRHSGRLASGLYSGSSVAFGGTSMAAAVATRRLVQALSMNPWLDKTGFLNAQSVLTTPQQADEPRLGSRVISGPDPRRVRA